MQSTGKKPVIDVIIVNYNAGAALTRCVQSVLAQQESVRIHVVDNASSDNSIARLRSHTNTVENLAVIANDGNPGFARAVNQAAGTLDKDGQWRVSGYYVK